MRSIQSLFAKILKIFNTQEDIPEFKYPKTEFKPLTRELCNELQIIPLFRIPPDSKYFNDPTMKKKEAIAQEKEITSFYIIGKISDLNRRKTKCADDKEKQILDSQIQNLSQKEEQLTQELEPMEIELCNILRKETYEKFGTCFSSKNDSVNLSIKSSHIKWLNYDVDWRDPIWLHKLENLVGYPKEHAYIYEDSY